MFIFQIYISSILIVSWLYSTVHDFSLAPLVLQRRPSRRWWSCSRRPLARRASRPLPLPPTRSRHSTPLQHPLRLQLARRALRSARRPPDQRSPRPGAAWAFRSFGSPAQASAFPSPAASAPRHSRSLIRYTYIQAHPRPLYSTEYTVVCTLSTRFLTFYISTQELYNYTRTRTYDVRPENSCAN